MSAERLAPGFRLGLTRAALTMISPTAPTTTGETGGLPQAITA